MSTISPGKSRSPRNNGFLSTVNSWKLSTKFLMTILVASLLPLIAAVAFNVFSTRNQLITEARASVAQQAESISPGIAQFIAREVAILDTISQNDSLRIILEEHNGHFSNISAEERTQLYLELDQVWRNGDESTPLIASALPTEPESHDHTDDDHADDDHADDDHADDEHADDDHADDEHADDDHADDEHADDDHADDEHADDEGIADATDVIAAWEGGSLASQYDVSHSAEHGELAHQFVHFINETNVELFVTDAAGGTVATTHILSDYYQADEGWWQSAYADGTGAFYISEPTFDESAGINALLIAIPIMSEDGDELLGILRGTISIEGVESLVASVEVGKTGFIELVSEEGTILASPEVHEEEGDEHGEDHDLDQLLSTFGQTGATNIISEHDGQESIIAIEGMGIPISANVQDPVAQAVNDLNWIVVAVQPLSDTTDTLNRLNLILISLTLLTAVVGTFAARFLINRSLRQIDAMRPVFESIQHGDYSARAEVLTGDELGVMAHSFNAMLDETTSLIQSDDERNKLQSSIITLLDEVSAVAEGDLTAEAEVRADITGAIADSFNFMIEQLRDIIGNVQTATLEVTTSANQIQSTAEMLAMGSKSQAGQIVDTSAAIDEMSVSIQQVSDNAARSATVGEQARENAQLGAQAVKATIGGMDRIRDEVTQTAERLGRLEASSREIGKVTKVINDIASRTSILAINASIQASEAGDAGRGFAVVAQEVELLADRSSAASQQINRLVKIIQDETGEVSSAMTSTSREVSRGANLATEAGQRLDEIEMVSTQLSSLIQSISQASQQQARGSEAIAQSMQEIAVVTNRTATGTNEATTSIGKLAILADELRESVSQFKIKA